jgi:FAD/FMN-containing dehydrogenase
MTNDLSHIISGEIDSSDAARRAYSRDASIFEVRPKTIVTPKDVSDIAALIRYATDHKTSLTARNGGTCMSGGSLTEGIVMNMSKYFNRMGQIDKKAKTIAVQGGVMHIEVEKYTNSEGLLFAPYTSSHDICGIGGMIGNNASGEKSIKYGSTSRNIASIKVVLQDGHEYTFAPLSKKELLAKTQQPDLEGEIYTKVTKLLEQNNDLIQAKKPTTHKNAAGYALWELWNNEHTSFDLGRLFVGAQGTLGIVTAATLKLVDLPKYSRMIVAPIGHIKDLPIVVQTILKHSPDTVETFDYHTYELAKKYYPEDAARTSSAQDQHMVVFAIFCGDEQHPTDVIAGAAKEELESLGYQGIRWVQSAVEFESYLLIRRKSFALLKDHPTAHSRAMPFIEDSIVPIERYGEFLSELELALKKFKMTYTYAGHIGDGSIRLIPLIDMEAKNAPDNIWKLEEAVNELVIKHGGSISVDHNDGLIRTPFLGLQFGPEMIELFEQIKDIFDPSGLFNPGKKVHGNAEYSKSKIIRQNT